jgi:hypothetical protein
MMQLNGLFWSPAINKSDLKGKLMRPITSLVIASTLAVVSTVAQAENAPAKPVKTDAPATPVTSAAADKPAETAKPVAQTNVAKPRESGLDQPLCTGE